MRRREFLRTLAGVALPAAASAVRAPRGLKITDVRVVVTNPERSPMGNFVVVKIVTSEDGLYGWGDATCTGSELAVAKFIEEYMRPVLIGRDPMRLEDIWQTLFHHPYYRSGSVHMSALSGVDMALWDIKGKVAGLPVYELLGGRARTKLLTYTSVSGRDFREVEEGARRMIERGYKVLKVQVRAPGLESGYAVPPSERQRAATEKAHQAGVPPVETWEPDAYVRTIPKLFEHLRKTLGEEIELLHDVHERITPSQALWLARALEPFRPFFLEDPLRPEHADTFRLIRRQCSTPIAMGEIWTGQWDGLFLITEHLIDYAPRSLPLRRNHDRQEDRDDRGAVRHPDGLARPGQYFAHRSAGQLPCESVRAELRDPGVPDELAGCGPGCIFQRADLQRRLREHRGRAGTGYRD